jgi:hypothetical protein
MSAAATDQAQPSVSTAERDAVNPHLHGHKSRPTGRVFSGFAVGLAAIALSSGLLDGSLVRFHNSGAGQIQAGASKAFLTASHVASLPPGGWRIVHSPSPRVGAFFQSVSCVSSSFCMAVGLANHALIEEWNGSVWFILPSPSPGTGSGLMSVSCASTDFCAAVGSYATSSGGGTLIDLWNSHTWTRDRVPNLGSLGLLSVSCPTPTFCAAVSFSGSGQPATVIWDGTDWTPTFYPHEFVPFYGVSCASTTFCMAVGALPDCNIPGVPGCFPKGAQHAAVWNGSRWTRVPMPVTPGGGVYSVDCTSSRFCFAGGNNEKGLVEAWDGTSWRVVPVPGAASIGDFSGVSCTGPAACTLLPASVVSGTLVTSQIEYWDGHALSAVQAPHLAGGQLNLVSVAVVAHGSATFQVAVGQGIYPTNPLVRTVAAIHE